MIRCEPTAAELRRELLRIYYDEGVAWVREHLGIACSGCITDLVVEYVQSDSDRLIEAEFGTA